MNSAELKKLLYEAAYEAAKKAVREELRDILTEAVDIASRPAPVTEQPVVVPARHSAIVVAPASQDRDQGLGALLQETANSMTRQDYQLAMVGNAPQVSMPDLEMGSVEDVPTLSYTSDLPDFAKNAAAIFKASQKIKKNDAV